MGDLRSLAVRRLSRLGPDRLRVLGARSTGPLTIPVGLAQGLRLRGIPLSHAHLGVMAYGILEPPVQEALRRHLGPGGVFYDVGANVGFFTLLGARLAGEAGHAYAIEPAPDNAAAIRSNVALNGLEASVTVLERAAGAGPGTGRLQLVDDQSWSKLAETGEHPGTDRTIDVQVDALDDLGLRPPTLVKIDVEGHELAVLAGMHRTLAAHAPVVVCELHDTAAEFVAFMDDAGYRVVNLESPGPIEAEPAPAHALALPAES
ncbi:MAG: FkbM family methyltransferase [Solirubrobacteraceae bacterium]